MDKTISFIIIVLLITLVWQVVITNDTLKEILKEIGALNSNTEKNDNM